MLAVLLSAFELLCTWLPGQATADKRSFAAFLSRNRIAADVYYADGPDHTTKQAATTLRLPDDSRVVKSLVFVVDDERVLVLARGCDRISLANLRQLCGAAEARLASPDEAEEATGFQPGCIPPLLAEERPVRVFMDEQVLTAPSPVFAGAGSSGEHLRIAPAELRRAAKATVAPLVVAEPAQSRLAAPRAQAPSAAPCAHSQELPAQTELHERDVRTRPTKISGDVWRVLRLNAISEDEAVEVEVRRVRRQGRLLVFASVVEHDGPAAASRPPVCQLIAGRHLVAAVGEDQAAAIMRRVRPGAVFRVRGRVQRNPREVDCAEPSTADIVASALELLHAAPPCTPVAPLCVNDAAAPAADQPRDQQGDVEGDLGERAGSPAPGLPAAAVAAATTLSEPSPEVHAATCTSVPPEASELTWPPPLLIDDADGVRTLCAVIDRWCSTSALVGIDLEWRPRWLAATPERSSPSIAVAVLQLASSDTVVVVDVLTLSLAHDGAMATLQGGLSKLMSAPTVTKLGFAVKGDVERLEAALPGCTMRTEAVVDLQPLVRAALGLAKGKSPALRHACLALLGLSLDKTQQTSDWEQRPLSQAQLAYAAMDAAVLPPLYEAVRRREVPAPAAAQPCTTPRTPEAERTGVSRSPVAAQATVKEDSETGAAPPLLSRQLPLQVDALLDGWLGREVGARSDAVQLCAALSEGAQAPPEGEAERFVMIEPRWKGCATGATLGSVADDGPPVRNQRRVVQCGEGGAVTQWANSACLYVNAGRYRNGPSARYRNRFWREADGSVLMSWFPGRGHTTTSAAVTHLLSPDAPVLLFCRRAPSHPYMLFGRLRAMAIAEPQAVQAEQDQVCAEVATASPFPRWPTRQSAHVVFQLLDATTLSEGSQDDAFATVLGGRDVELVRPEDYAGA